jgi:urate oxidase
LSAHFRVRIVKVIRNRDGSQDVFQFSVQILLEGDIMDSAFLEGDNKNVVPTDTCKNTVYCVANKNNFSSPEEFGIILCKHFIAEYPSIVNRISVQIIKDRWERLMAPNSNGATVAHKHVFKRIGPNRPFAHVQAEKRPGSNLKINVQSGFKGLDIMKTTQSGFVDFHKCKNTSLPEVTDRILGTSIDAIWSYSSAAVSRGSIDFNKVSTFVDVLSLYFSLLNAFLIYLILLHRLLLASSLRL